MGYCWPQSIVAGEPVALHLSSEVPVDLEIVRDGLEPAVVHSCRDVDVAALAVPGDAPENGCAWPARSTTTSDRPSPR